MCIISTVSRSRVLPFRGDETPSSPETALLVVDETVKDTDMRRHC